jgi:iron complex outermembrane recepter protein
MTCKNKFFTACVLFISASCLSAETGDNKDRQELPEIEVRESATDENAASNFSGIKSKVLARDLPLAVETLSPEILQNLRSQNLESLLDGYTSGSSSPAEGGRNSSIILRGFSDASFYRNGLNDSLGSVPLRDVANIETVEILKGANSALYGPGEPGGTINIITKQPQFEAAHSAQFSIGSYQKYRAELDSTGPLASSDKLAYRMITAYEGADSFRDTVESNKVFASPSIAWLPNNNWNLIAEVEFIQHKTPFDTGLVAVDDSFPLPSSRFLGEPGLGKTRLQALTTSLSAEYKQADSWSLSAKLLWQNTDIDGFRVEPDELDEDGPDGEKLLSREVQHESDDADGFSAQLEISRKFGNVALQQQILAGYEFSSANNHVVLSGSDTESDPFEINIFDIRYGQDIPDLSPLRQTSELLQQHSFYLQDFITLGNKLRLLLGTRLDKIDIDSSDVILATAIRQNNNELSSRVAAMYTWNQHLSLFASFSESSEPNEGLTPQGSPLKPSRGNSIEAGIKFRQSFMNLSLDLSFYSIEQTNMAVDAPGAPGFEIQTARQKSEGIDLEMSLSPASWFNTNVKYGYTDAEIFDDPEIPDGTQSINTPLHKLVLSSIFSFNIRNENDLQAGLSFSYRSEQKASLDPDELRVKLAGYWLGNLFINYTISPRISLGLNIHNLLGENYLAASQVDLLHIHPGAPTMVMGSLKFNF